MRRAFRLVLAAAVAVLATSSSRAQKPNPNEKYSRTNVFTFAPAPSKITEIPDGKSNDLKAQAALQVRPNATTELYLWVKNPNPEQEEFTVEVAGPEDALGKAAFVVRTKVTIPGDHWKRVKLPKLPAPAAPATPAAAPAAAPAATPPPPAPEPPPGLKLPLSKGEATLSFRLLDKDGKPVPDTEGKSYIKDLVARPLAPLDYVKDPVATVTPGKGTLEVKVVVSQQSDFKQPGEAPVRLWFPPQEALKGAVVRDGSYRRPLTFDPARPERGSVALVGTIEGAREKARVYVGVDGIDRAFAYTLNPLGRTPATQLLPARTPAVRLSRVAVPPVTQPSARFPVLIEL